MKGMNLKMLGKLVNDSGFPFNPLFTKIQPLVRYLPFDLQIYIITFYVYIFTNEKME